MSTSSSPVLRYSGAAALVLGLVLLVSKLALAPVQGVHNAAECRRAYAKAQTRSDSNAVDFLSFPDPAGRHITRRCNEVLPAVAGVPGR
jgi:hypothetical protein